MANRSVSDRALGSGFLILALAALPALIYINTLGNSFQYDDTFYILKNRYVHNFSGIGHFFVSPRLISNLSLSGYRPITMATFAMNYALGGANPVGYHLTNVLIHILNTLLVYAVALGLMRSFEVPKPTYGALAMAVLFACHPVNTQPVNYISGRSTLLVSGFSLLCFLLYARMRDAETPFKRNALWAGSLAAYACALLSKEEAIAAPGLLAFYELCRLRPQVDRKALRRIFLSLVPFVALTLAFLVFVVFALGVISDTPQARSTGDNLLTQARAVFIYLKMLLAPTNLSIDHSIAASTSVFEPGALAAVIALMALLFGSLSLLQVVPIIPFGIWWFVLALVPSSTLVALRLVVNEQRMYLPAVGMMVIAGAAFGAALDRAESANAKRLKRALVSAFAAILVILCVLTAHRNTQWHSPMTLWTSALEKYPNSARANTEVANLYLQTGNVPEALKAAKKAVEIAPDVLEVRLALAKAYSLSGMQNDALVQARAAVDLNPASSDAQTTLGTVYARLERYEEAKAAWRKAVEVDPQNSEAQENLRNLEAGQTTGRSYQPTGATRDNSSGGKLYE